MEIKPTIKYEYKGLDYTCPTQIRGAVERELGVLIERTGLPLARHQDIMDMLVEERTKLIQLLSTFITMPGADPINVLDC